MWFETFERRHAQELEEQWKQKYSISESKKEHEVNPTGGKVEMWEKRENADQKEQNEKKDEQKLLEEKSLEAKKRILEIEKNERPKEQLAALQSVEAQGDFWPPVQFDDTNSALKSQVGSTEGGSSLDKERG